MSAVEREAGYQRTLIEAAQLAGWRVAHFHTARTAAGGYVTPAAGDAVGFPDLVLVHEGHGAIAFVEVKSERGAVRREQRVWLDAIVHAAIEGGSRNVWAFIWRPSDWPWASRFLRNPWSV